jgi:hypothetical protein
VLKRLPAACAATVSHDRCSDHRSSSFVLGPILGTREAVIYHRALIEDKSLDRLLSIAVLNGQVFTDQGERFFSN